MFIGSQKGALEKGALKSVFWAINAAFISILRSLRAAMAAAVAFPLDIASLSTTEVVFLMPFPI